jgi:hypothetical protein
MSTDTRVPPYVAATHATTSSQREIRPFFPARKSYEGAVIIVRSRGGSGKSSEMMASEKLKK